MKSRLVSVFAVALFGAATTSFGGYAQEVLSLSPVAYYQLNNPTTPDLHIQQYEEDVVNSANPGTYTGQWGYSTSLGGNDTSAPIGNTIGPRPTDTMEIEGVSTAMAGFADYNVGAGFVGQPVDENGDPTGGLDDSINLGTNFAYDTMTVSFWCSSLGAYGNDARIFTTGSGAANQLSIMHVGVGSITIATGSGGGMTNTVQTLGASLYGDWNHIVVVRNGDNASNAQIYINGKAFPDYSAGEFIVDPGDSYGTSVAQTLLGARHGTSQQGWGGFIGTLDEVAIWDRALSAQEVDDLFMSAFDATGVVQQEEIVPPPALQADFNGDNIVDVIDLGILAGGWQTDAGHAGGDANEDGIVDVIDLGILAGEWQQTAAAAGATVPEPATLSLLALGGLALARRRRA